MDLLAMSGWRVLLSELTAELQDACRLLQCASRSAAEGRTGIARLRPPADHRTMGPQPDLAQHQGSRRLVANGVKCMSNYSELSTYHEYGNIFPMSCTVFALQ